MSFKFEFKIDYEKLTALLDTFLKSHSDELTSIMGKCLKLQQSEEPVQAPIIQSLPTPPPQAPEQEQPDYKVDNRPLIGDSIPEEPFQNLFNPNSNTTRYQDRNNPNIKKGYRN